MCELCKDDGPLAGRGPEKLCTLCGEGIYCCLQPCDDSCVKCKAGTTLTKMRDEEPLISNRMSTPCGLQESGSTSGPLLSPPCELERDRQAAMAAYQLFKVEAHTAKSFALDVLLGNFERRSLDGAQPLSAGDLRHRSRCPSCSGGTRAVEWCEHPHELWPSGKADLDVWDLTAQIQALVERREALLAAMPAAVQPLIERRLSHMADVRGLWTRLKGDHWNPDYASGLAQHVIGLRHAGISNLLPARLQHQPGGACVDEHNQPWGRLRGKDSLVAKVTDYMQMHETSYDWIDAWLSAVAGNGWSDWGKAMRIFWVKQRDQTIVKAMQHYWNNPTDPVNAAKECSGQYQMLTSQGERAAEHKRAWFIWHAFVQEILASVDFTNNNRGEKTVRLIRTESQAGLEANGVAPGVKKENISIRRGACESASVFQPYINAGPHATFQTVPHHRIVTVYFTERSPASNKCGLKDDHENEFVFLPHGIVCDYDPSGSGGGSPQSSATTKDKYGGLFD